MAKSHLTHNIKRDPATDWSKTTKAVSKASKQAPRTQAQLLKQARKLALKYYRTEDLSMLAPYQLDKVITWVTKMKPDAGKNRDRKSGRTAGRYLQGKL